MAGGLFIAYFLYHPHYTQGVSDTTVMVCAAVFVASMLCNLYTHIILMRLRPSGSTVRRIPNGFMFEYAPL